MGNEKADELTKKGTQQQQDENPNSYYQRKSSEQTIIFRLNTVQNIFYHNLHRVMKVVCQDTSMCQEQNTEYLSQQCKLHQTQREAIRHKPAQETLCEPVEDIRKTTRFVEGTTGVQV